MKHIGMGGEGVLHRDRPREEISKFRAHGRRPFASDYMIFHQIPVIISSNERDLKLLSCVMGWANGKSRRCGSWLIFNLTVFHKGGPSLGTSVEMGSSAPDVVLMWIRATFILLFKGWVEPNADRQMFS